MAKYLDETGLSALWERMRQYVYDCCCSQKVTYKLTKDGNTITLVGSDGTKSSVTIN